ncbi:MAG: undecaprenyl diphosphate synthase family protein [Acholeplasmatales bacterium]|jgi:undecaprenyl diphosphate synthase|nr:undecaprenyl diphosphate synthase family protein [Acholeplasmatales bacterium]
MDGNGRWAQAKLLSRSVGHYYGGLNIQNIVLAAINSQRVRMLSLFVFSCDNFQRPQEEVDFIFNQPLEYLNASRIENIVKSNIVIKHLGYEDQIPPKFLVLLKHLIEVTKNNTGLIINLAINYSSRREIHEGILLDEPVDLVIRTGRRKRLSDFLLYQSAYAEIYFSHILWPSFKPRHFLRALNFYDRQKRTFGKIS